MSNPTSNFGWQMPEPTDLVTNLPADFEVFGQSVDSDFADLLGGTTGQVLKKNSNTDLDFVWSADAAGMTNPMTTTGDTIYGSPGSTPERLGIGSTGQILTVAGGVPTWATPAASGGFVGAVVYNSGNFSVSNGTWTTINWDSELLDTDGFHSTSSNTDRFTIPTGKAGKYCVTMNFSIGAGSSTIESYFGKNTDNFAFIGATGNATSKNFTVTRQTYVSLAQGDYVFLRLIQSSGSVQDVLGGAGQSTFAIQYLGA